MPVDIDALKARIRQEVADLDPAMIKRACLDVKTRCEKLDVKNPPTNLKQTSFY